MKSRKTVGGKILAWTIVVMAASLMLLGWFNSFTVRRIDATYSELISGKLKVVGVVRLITRNSAETNRSLLNYLVGDQREQEFQLARYHAAVSANDENFEKLRALFKDAKSDPRFENLVKVRAEYLKSANQLILLSRSDPHNAVERYRIDTVRPLFDRYLEAQDAVADQAQKEAEESSRNLSKDSERWVLFSLSFGAWPLVLGVLVGALLVGSLAWLGWRHNYGD